MNFELFSRRIDLRIGTGPGRPPDQTAPPAAISVSRLNAIIRDRLEQSVPPLWIEGEVTGWKRYPSGHCYFTLRDAGAQVRCVMFRNEASRLPTHPEEGMKVRVLAIVSLYEKRGEFQLIVHELEGTGAGGLWRVAFEKLRRKLEAEGLLAPERKRPLPGFPRSVGVVTSPVGAALHDILHVLERRAPWTRVVFCPAKVQGDGAAEEVAGAIRLLGRSGEVDVMIVGRGGGSIEDLWAFNEEIVARAIAASPVPVISAVGHEVDVTIADLVADERAPTPSVAAERAVPDGRAVERWLAERESRMGAALKRCLVSRERTLGQLESALGAAAKKLVRVRTDALREATGRLGALSPLAALARGFAVPSGMDGRILRRVEQFVPGSRFRLRVSDGSVGCDVVDVAPDETEQE